MNRLQLLLKPARSRAAVAFVEVMVKFEIRAEGRSKSPRSKQQCR